MNISEELARLRQRRSQAESAIDSNKSKLVSVKQTLSERNSTVQSLSAEKTNLENQKNSLLSLIR